MKTVRLVVASAFIALLGLTGCTQSNHDRLLGHWAMDLDAFKATNPDLAANEEGLAMVEAMASELSFEFTRTEMIVKGKRALGGQASKPEVTPYTVKSDEGDVVTIEGSVRKGDGHEQQLMKIRFRSADQIELGAVDDDPGIPKVVLKRR